MDPNATWEDVLAALIKREPGAAIDAGGHLASWLMKGGFKPKAWEEHPSLEILFWAWMDEQ